MLVRVPLRTAAFAALVHAFLTACGGDSGPPDDSNPPPGGGTPAGDPVTQQVGPAGGTVAMPDGRAALVIPAGVLAAPTNITIRPVVSTAVGGLGVAYRIEPSPLPVTAPVELQLAMDEADLGDLLPEGVGVAVRDAGGAWYGDVSTSGQLVAASGIGRALGFRDGRVVSVTRVEAGDEWIEYTLVAFWIVRPRQPIIVGRGESVQLSIEACLREDETAGSDDVLPRLPSGDPASGAECRPSIREGTWSVNGVRGGNTSVGFVTAGNPSSVAEFLAPNQVPSPNPVTVTASMYWRERNLTAPPFRIPIAIRGGNLGGTASATVASGLVEVQDLYSYQVNVTWVRDEANSSEVLGIEAYNATGTAVVTAVNRCISQLKPDTLVINQGSLTIDRRDSTWSGQGDAGPPTGFTYYDTCANMSSVLPVSMVPFLMADGPQRLPVSGPLKFPEGAGIKLTGSFSYAPQ